MIVVDEFELARAYALAAGYRFEHWDLGEPTWSRHPRLERAMIDLANGLRFGYPLCCVQEFCLDTVDGRMSGARRGSLQTERGGRYVPCSRCCREIGREIID